MHEKTLLPVRDRKDTAPSHRAGRATAPPSIAPWSHCFSARHRQPGAEFPLRVWVWGVLGRGCPRGERRDKNQNTGNTQKTLVDHILRRPVPRAAQLEA